MATIEKLWLATLTKNEDDAGTDENKLNLTINIDGEDVLDKDFGFMTGSGLSGGLGPDSGWLEQGQAALSGGSYHDPGEPLPSPIDSNLLTNSSIRLGIRDNDAWGPQHVLLFGRAQPVTGAASQIIALAMETDLTRWLSTDSSEGKLTMPIRLVGSGGSTTLISRALLLVYTGSGSNVETDADIQIQISAGGAPVLDQTISNTPQSDLEQYTANWYPLDVTVPFTKGNIDPNGIQLSIVGDKADDAWLPSQIYVFGLDTATGRPNEVVTLVAIPQWDLGVLSTDMSEGQPSYPLPIST